MTILDSMSDPNLFGRWFRGESWHPWRAFLSALFALPFDDEMAETFRRHTGRQELPTEPAREGWAVVGRRGGKSRVAALVGTYLACFRKYDDVLAPGEVGTVSIIASDRRQARVVMRYVNGFLDAVSMLSRMVVSRTRESVELSNRVMIEVHTCSFRSTRGYTLIGAICDEVAFWQTDDGSANPDTEILNGLRPGMATVSGALLLAISSPYSRRGELWRNYERHHGRDGDPVLVWQADTRSMNCTVDEQFIADAYEADEASAAAEYGAEFRKDIESYIGHEAVAECVVDGRHELPRCNGVEYRAFCDPSGGSVDSMTLAIAHRDRESGKVVLDCVREIRAPFDPSNALKEFAVVLDSYHVGSIVGDRYSGQWVVEGFRRHDITYRPTAAPKSELYSSLLPALNSRQVELLDHPRMIRQLLGLERRTARSGKDSIDHAPRAFDDVINACAGAVAAARGRNASMMREQPIYGL